jgi:hypothetical protein
MDVLGLKGMGLESRNRESGETRRHEEVRECREPFAERVERELTALRNIDGRRELAEKHTERCLS